jgi:hypothetical protein
MACRGQAEPIPAAYTPFNQQTDDGKDMSAYSALLDQAIHCIVNIKDDKDIDSLFNNRNTNVLSHTINGLNDFELMSFLVIQEGA